MPNQELIASHNLRATHDILSTLSGSKRALETILENQTDIFCLISDQGRIIKGNKSLASFFQTKTDLLQKHFIKELFSSSSWQLFQNKVETLKKHKEKSNISFELLLDGEMHKNAAIDMLWTVSRFESISDRRGSVYSVIGRDMSEIKKFQKRLSMIFNSVPLAIFQINNAGKVIGPYSAYTEILFGQENIEMTDFKKLLGPAYINMTQSQRFGVDQLMESLRGEEFWYDINKCHFPKEINLGVNGKDLWIGLSYSPVVRDGVVDEILVVAEDVTDRIKARKIKESRDNVEGALASIFSDAREIDPKFISAAILDIDRQLEAIGNFKLTHNSLIWKILNPLHSIKGTARSSGLTFFTSLVHGLEDDLLAFVKDKATVEEIAAYSAIKMGEINKAWNNVKNAIKLLYPETVEDNGVKSTEAAGRIEALLEGIKSGKVSDIIAELENIRSGLSGVKKKRNLKELESKIKLNVQQVTTELNKPVNLELSIEEGEVDEVVFGKINEILLHLVTNAIDHGIESGSERLKNNKEEKGTIKVTVENRDNAVSVSVEDNGGGIDGKKVGIKALEKGIVTESELSDMNNDDKIRLIFSPGFSTKDKANSISGRGLGMDAAEQAAKEISADGNGIHVSSVVGRGTVFILKARV
jgi:PAS domain S-box-containing protein